MPKQGAHVCGLGRGEPLHKTVVVINPDAGSGRGARVWLRLLARHPQLAELPCVQTGNPRQAREELHALWHPELERVIAIGGDGTLHAVANALLERACPSPVALALVPVGSGSDLARGLGLPRRPLRALRHALAAPAQGLDVLRVRQRDSERYVVNVASLGISGAVAAAVNAQRRRWAGSYLWAALTMLARHRPSGVRVELDGNEWYVGGHWLLALANGTRFGRGMRIAPRARVDDGCMDVVLAEAVSVPGLLPALARLYLGRHLGLPFVRSARATRVRIEPSQPELVLEADGELLASGAADVELIPAALPFVR